MSADYAHGFGYKWVCSVLQGILLVCWICVTILSVRAKSQGARRPSDQCKSVEQHPNPLRTDRTAHSDQPTQRSVPESELSELGTKPVQQLSEEPTAHVVSQGWALLQAYDVVCGMKCTVNLMIGGSLVVQGADAGEEGALIANHLAFVALAVEISCYVPVAVCLASYSFGTQMVSRALLLGATGSIVLYSIQAGLCGYSSAPWSLGCESLNTEYTQSNSAGRYLLLGCLSGVVFLTLLVAFKFRKGCFQKIRRLTLVQYHLSSGCVFSVACIVAWLFEPASGGYSIAPKLYLLCDLYLLYHVMWNDTAYWSQLSLQPWHRGHNHAVGVVCSTCAIEQIVTELHRLKADSAKTRSRLQFTHIPVWQLAVEYDELLGKGATASVYKGHFKANIDGPSITVAVKALVLEELDDCAVEAGCYELMVLPRRQPRV